MVGAGVDGLEHLACLIIGRLVLMWGGDLK